MWWKKSDRNGIFIYGDGPKDAVPVIWKLSYGRELSNNEPWRAGVLVDVRGEPIYRDAGPQILFALDRQYVFKLQTEDGSIFPCRIYDLDDFYAYGGLIYGFVICSRDQPMEYVK
jgi:hypothetical protein